MWNGTNKSLLKDDDFNVDVHAFCGLGCVKISVCNRLCLLYLGVNSGSWTWDCWIFVYAWRTNH